MSEYQEIKVSIYIKKERIEEIRKKAADYYKEEITDERLDKILCSLVDLIVANERIPNAADALFLR